MPNNKAILARTDAGNLIANLRGEVGEVITTWLLLRHFLQIGRQLVSEDPAADFGNKDLNFTNLIADKLSDELVGRLSELAEYKIGQLNFYFAATKLGRLLDETKTFSRYIVRNKIRDKRNRDVSHKHFPGGKPVQYIRIDYRVLVRAVALALHLMKKFDRCLLGPCAPLLWREARRRRYEFLVPPRAGYLLVPYLHLSPDDRILVVKKELDEGRQVFSAMQTEINGATTTVMASKQWGVILLGDKLVALEQYPLISLGAISFGLEPSSN